LDHMDARQRPTLIKDYTAAAVLQASGIYRFLQVESGRQALDFWLGRRESTAGRHDTDCVAGKIG